MPLAYRVWRWKDGLQSLNFETVWRPRANFAQCLAAPDPSYIYDDSCDDFDPSIIESCTVVPNRECKDSRGFGCGFWAHIDPTRGLAELGPRNDYGSWNPKLSGLVYGWGHVIEKEDGLVRCEIMDIWALAPVRGQVENSWDNIRQWAAENNIPCELFENMDSSIKYLRRMAVELQRK